jgi:DNA segregation ATPase FtsK/SpoIIIE, S-DNA-T family
MSFAPAGQLQVFGIRFHSDADKIVAWLLGQPKSAWDTLTLDADSLWQFVNDTFVGDFVESTANAGKVEEAMAFAERMRTFCERIVALRQRAKNFETWEDIFLGNELSVNKAVLEADDFSVGLTGRVDAVRLDGQHHLEIVDYKLSQGSNQMQDMVQLAIYGRMLELAKPGCQFAGVVEYYLPEFQEVKINRSELDKLFDDLVVPVLGELFGPPTSTVKTTVATTTATIKQKSVKAGVAESIPGDDRRSGSPSSPPRLS